MWPIETYLTILGLASNAHSLFTGFKTGKQMKQVIRELEKTKSELQRLSNQILYAPSVQEIMTVQFIKKIHELFLQKKALLENIVKLINNENTEIEEIASYINSLSLINENLLLLKCECYIVDVSSYFSDFQKALQIEYKIIKLLIEVIQDVTLIKDLTADDLIGFFNKAEEINLYMLSIIVYVLGKYLHGMQGEAVLEEIMRLRQAMPNGGDLSPRREPQRQMVRT